MRTDSTGARLTPLMSNETLTRVTGLRLQTRRKFTNRRHGEHISGKGGTSIEFADYRDYVPGDDVRFVDWNIFSRLHRPYLKLYHQEEVMHVLVLVDASASMLFENKLRRAQELAAAFAACTLHGAERLSVQVFHGSAEGPRKLRPSSGRGNMGRAFRFIESIQGGGRAPVEQGIADALQRHVGRGVAVVLSDFLTFGDLQGTFNRLFSVGLEPFAVQILGPTELDPELAGDVRLLDSESGEQLDVSSVGSLIDIYHECLDDLRHELRALCRSRSGRFMRIASDAPLDWVLFDQMRRKGWLA